MRISACRARPLWLAPVRRSGARREQRGRTVSRWATTTTSCAGLSSRSVAARPRCSSARSPPLPERSRPTSGRSCRCSRTTRIDCWRNCRASTSTFRRSRTSRCSLAPATPPLPEGAPKPELLIPATQKIATARKIAAHVGVSWEAYSGDYMAFITAVQTELMKKVIDAENQQLYAGTGEANGQVNGLATASGILTLDAQHNHHPARTVGRAGAGHRTAAVGSRARRAGSVPDAPVDVERDAPDDQHPGELLRRRRSQLGRGEHGMGCPGRGLVQVHPRHGGSGRHRGSTGGS